MPFDRGGRHPLGLRKSNLGEDGFPGLGGNPTPGRRANQPEKPVAMLTATDIEIPAQGHRGRIHPGVLDSAEQNGRISLNLRFGDQENRGFGSFPPRWIFSGNRPKPQFDCQFVMCLAWSSSTPGSASTIDQRS
jgi:hypothetical protein